MFHSQFAISAPGVTPPDSAIRNPPSAIKCPSSHDFCFLLSAFHFGLTSDLRLLASGLRPLSSVLLLLLLLTGLHLSAAEAPAVAPSNSPADLDNSVSAIEARIAASRKTRAVTNVPPAPAPAATPATNAAVAPATSSAPAASTNSSNALDDTYRLAIGDRLSFRIVEDEEDPKPLFVTDSGDLEVPFIGRFPAIRRTCKELAAALKAELEKEYYYQATVVIAVDVMTKSRGKVYLVGPVRIPGPQEVPSDEVFTLSKAILRAGGFNDYADRKNVRITRKGVPGGDGDQTFTVNVAEILDKGKSDSDLKLEPGDRIFIPERSIRF